MLDRICIKNKTVAGEYQLLGVESYNRAAAGNP
jgi:hypothetical protein